MKIVIVGAGDVGTHLCAILSEKNHQVTLIESDENTGQYVDDQHNVKVICGNGGSAKTLVKADVSNCHFFLAMTSDDKTNLISCSLAKALGSEVTIARIHDGTYQDNSYVNYQKQFGIDITINPEALCAIELAKAMRNPGRISVESFARGQVEVQQVKISKESKLIGRTLAAIKLPPDLRIGYVQRDEILDVPTAETKLQPNDVITLFGSPETLFEFKPLFDPESKIDSIRLVLFGGTETAIAITRLLNHQRFKIRIVDSDLKKCQELAETFPKINVIHGDVTSLRLMEEEQIGKCDYFVACTKKDEDNIMTGLQAAKLGSAHVQLVINRVDYEAVISKLKWLIGVELAVSPRVATGKEILRYISTEPYITLAKLPNNTGKIIEIQVGPNSSVIDKRLRDISWPQRCVVVALLHDQVAKVPGANDIINEKDHAVLIIKEDNIPELLRLFHGEE